MKIMINVLCCAILLAGCKSKAGETGNIIFDKGKYEKLLHNEADTIFHADTDSLLLDYVYSKILDWSYVSEQVKQLESRGSRIEVLLMGKPSRDNAFFVIQVMVDEDFRMRPIFNFKYFPSTDSLFYEETLNDTLIPVK